MSGKISPQRFHEVDWRRELATGTDLRFEALGAVAPRGVPDEWELFEASIG